MARKHDIEDALSPHRPGLGARICETPDCAEPGHYRAPRSRAALRDYVWLCLEHVRQYNSAWDYYAGMSEREIEAHLRHDATWRRPSWPFGGQRPRGARPHIRDHFGVFDEDGWGVGGDHGTARAARMSRDREHEALAIMDLEPPVTADEVRSRYMELAKQLHPDANGGDKQAEERLKLVNQAYATLKNGDCLQWQTR